MIGLDDEVRELVAMSTPEQVFEKLRDEAVRHGMQHLAWGAKLPFPVEEARFVMYNSYSPAWQARYAEMGYVAIDPTVEHGLNSVLPILWSDKSMRSPGEFWEDAKGHGLSVGIAQSVWDRHGCCSMLTLSRDSVQFTQSELFEKLPKVVWLANVAHAAMIQLILPEEVPQVRAKLTAQEKETLKFAAAGLSSQAIGDRLNLDARTADFHLRNAQIKLAAGNRTASVCRAMKLGLI